MNLPEGCDLTYMVMHEAYYARVIERPHILVQAAVRDGGTAWEFAVEEHDLGEPTIRLAIFDDAFVALRQIPEFFEMLATDAPETLPEVKALLDLMGAADRTKRKPPSKASDPTCPSCGQSVSNCLVVEG